MPANNGRRRRKRRKEGEDKFSGLAAFGRNVLNVHSGTRKFFRLASSIISLRWERSYGRYRIVITGSYTFGVVAASYSPAASLLETIREQYR